MESRSSTRWGSFSAISENLASTGGCTGALDHFGNDVRMGAVENALRRVEAQPVAMKLADPVLRVADEVFAHGTATLAIEIDRLAPLVRVTIGEVVAAEAGKVVAVRAEVVVDHVQDHTDSVRMSGIDEATKRVRIAVAVKGREQVHPVVAPVEAAGKLGDRHELDAGDAQLGELRQLAQGGVERAFLQ